MKQRHKYTFLRKKFINRVYMNLINTFIHKAIPEMNRSAKLITSQPVSQPSDQLTHLCRPVRSTFAVRETASLGIMGAPRVPPLNPSETIVF